jgi:hypothetical protein
MGDCSNKGKNDGKKWTCRECGGWSWGDRPSCFGCGVPRGKKQNGAGGAAAGVKQPATHTVGDFILVGNGKKGRKQAKALEQRLALADKAGELARQLAEAKNPATSKAPEDLDGMDVGSGEGTHEREAEIGKQLKAAKDGLAEINRISEAFRSELFGESGSFEAAVARKQASVDRLSAELRGCKPMPQRLAQAQRHKKAVEGKLAAATQRDSELAAQLEKLGSERAAQLEKLEKYNAELAVAAQEVGRLASEQAREQGAGPQLSAEGVAPGAVGVANATGSVVPPGCVSIAFAEERWAEREAAYLQEMVQLQALLGAQDDDIAPSEASPSEAGELGSADQLEADEAWSKVERSKRKAVLGRSGRVLATKVRSGISRVSGCASPFTKK